MYIYEAWDLENGNCIYYGSNKSNLISEVSDYIEYQNHIDETMISYSDINELNEEVLKSVGIKLFINPL